MTLDNVQDLIERIREQDFEFHLVVGRHSPNGKGNLRTYQHVTDPLFLKIASDCALSSMVEMYKPESPEDKHDDIF